MHRVEEDNRPRGEKESALCAGCLSFDTRGIWTRSASFPRRPSSLAVGTRSVDSLESGKRSGPGSSFETKDASGTRSEDDDDTRRTGQIRGGDVRDRCWFESVVIR